MSPRTSLCSYIILALRDRGLYDVYNFKYNSALALGGASVVWHFS